MNTTDFEARIDTILELIQPYTEQGYTYQVKRYVTDDNEMYSYEAKLKKGNVTILIELVDDAIATLTRVNTYTQARHQSYLGTEVFTAADLQEAVAYNFPLPENF